MACQIPLHPVVTIYEAVPLHGHLRVPYRDICPCIHPRIHFRPVGHRPSLVVDERVDRQSQPSSQFPPSVPVSPRSLHLAPHAVVGQQSRFYGRSPVPFPVEALFQSHHTRTDLLQFPLLVAHDGEDHLCRQFRPFPERHFQRRSQRDAVPVQLVKTGILQKHLRIHAQIRFPAAAVLCFRSLQRLQRLVRFRIQRHGPEHLLQSAVSGAVTLRHLSGQTDPQYRDPVLVRHHQNRFLSGRFAGQCRFHCLSHALIAAPVEPVFERSHPALFRTHRLHILHARRFQLLRQLRPHVSCQSRQGCQQDEPSNATVYIHISLLLLCSQNLP